MPSVRLLKEWVDLFLSLFVNERRLVLEDIQSPTRSASVRKGLCLFAHFDPQGRIDPYVVHYLSELSKADHDIVFVSTSAQPFGADAEKIIPYCLRLIRRRNLGLDFGSWKIALSAAGDLRRYDRLVLANDSVYGPLFDLRELFAGMDAGNFDVFGATDSLEQAHHLQSYFLAFGRRALESPFFRDFWGRFRFLRGKTRVISRYELGLTEAAERAGLKVGAFVPYERAEEFARLQGDRFQYRAKIEREPLNSTLFCWDLLIREARFPFLKTELLKQNRFGSREVPRWAEILRASGSTYDPELIRAHLKRVGGVAG